MRTVAPNTVYMNRIINTGRAKLSQSCGLMGSMANNNDDTSMTMFHQ